MQTADSYLYLLLILTLIFLSMCLIWPVRAIVRRMRKEAALTRPAAWVWRIAGLLSVLNIAYIVGLLAAIMTLGQGAFAQGIPPILLVLYTLPLIGLVLTLALIGLTVMAWKNGTGSFLSRAYTSLITIAALAFSWFLNAFGLLGYQF
jgi:hypothetical protein